MNLYKSKFHKTVLKTVNLSKYKPIKINCNHFKKNNLYEIDAIRTKITEKTYLIQIRLQENGT